MLHLNPFISQTESMIPLFKHQLAQQKLHLKWSSPERGCKSLLTYNWAKLKRSRPAHNFCSKVIRKL